MYEHEATFCTFRFLFELLKKMIITQNHFWREKLHCTVHSDWASVSVNVLMLPIICETSLLQAGLWQWELSLMTMKRAVKILHHSMSSQECCSAPFWSTASGAAWGWFTRSLVLEVWKSCNAPRERALINLCGAAGPPRRAGSSPAWTFRTTLNLTRYSLLFYLTWLKPENVYTSAPTQIC